jgi:hypothetical protein
MSSQFISTTYSMCPGLEVEVSGTCYEAIPTRGPSYSSGGEPRENAWVEDIRVMLNGSEIFIDGLFLEHGSKKGMLGAIEEKLLRKAAEV